MPVRTFTVAIAALNWALTVLTPGMTRPIPSLIWPGLVLEASCPLWNANAAEKQDETAIFSGRAIHVSSMAMSVMNG
jgi:hypothetical protein